MRWEPVVFLVAEGCRGRRLWFLRRWKRCGNYFCHWSKRERAMSNQLLCRSGWGPSSLWWMSSSIPVVPLGSVDLSLRHVSTTWPGHYEQWTRCQRSVSEEEPVCYTGPAGRELKNWAMKEALRLDRFTCVVLWQTSTCANLIMANMTKKYNNGKLNPQQVLIIWGIFFSTEQPLFDWTVCSTVIVDSWCRSWIRVKKDLTKWA